MTTRTIRKPRRALAKADNRLRYRADHLRRLAAARTPSEQVGAAVAYLRSAISGAADRDAANRLVDQLVPELIGHADRLLTHKTRRQN